MAKRWINLDEKDVELIITTINFSEIKSKQATALLNKLHKTQKRISISSAKAKGCGLQHWTCEQISNILSIPFENKNDQCEIHCREMGQSGTDVILRGKAFKRFPYSIECKNTENINLLDAVNQAKSNQQKDTDWLLIHKKKALAKPIIIMSWEAFEKLFRKGMK
jgi:hypothetical protein